MALADLVATLRTDLSDPGGDLFTDEVLGRCILKGVYRLARDLDITLSVVDGEVSPEPEGETRELLLILGQIHACQVMRAATANAFSFSSGDKRVDKSKQPEHWAKLEEDLKAVYKQRLGEIKPGASASPEDYIISPSDLKPVIYEQGSDL
ncbi:MAG: hypothetical protein GXP48_05000 [Acidobacteria bacterium]|nr:hypothetical protein [Acidobacteriota bacterium]